MPRARHRPNEHLATRRGRDRRDDHRAGGEGIVNAIGASETHTDVLAFPQRISRLVLKRGLDAQTAFEILSITCKQTPRCSSPLQKRMRNKNDKKSLARGTQPAGGTAEQKRPCSRAKAILKRASSLKNAFILSKILRRPKFKDEF